jgi:hypothetical protein
LAGSVNLPGYPDYSPVGAAVPAPSRAGLRVALRDAVELAGRGPEVALRDDRVAVEHGAGLVPGELHRDALGDAALHHVADGGAAAVVQHATREAGRLARLRPARAEVFDRAPVVPTEDERHHAPEPLLVVTDDRTPALEERTQLIREGEHARRSCLARARV